MKFSPLSFLMFILVLIIVWRKWESSWLNACKYYTDAGVCNQVFLVGSWILEHNGYCTWSRFAHVLLLFLLTYLLFPIIQLLCFLDLISFQNLLRSYLPWQLDFVYYVQINIHMLVLNSLYLLYSNFFIVSLNLKTPKSGSWILYLLGLFGLGSICVYISWNVPCQPSSKSWHPGTIPFQFVSLLCGSYTVREQ